MSDAQTFIAASPGEAAGQLGDTVHVWRLPWRREEGRARLLAVLAAYLHVDASGLQLETGAHGKPHLPDVHGLRFNWSHSGEFALLVLARDLEVGVDIEQIREGVRVLELSRRFFAPGEADILAALSGSSRDASFFQLWTAKEAVLKALGQGLAFGLERIRFAHRQDRWQPDRFDAEAGSARGWQVMPLDANRNYADALAWYGPPRPVRTWTPATKRN